ncbi:MAG: FAD-dependent oxidoreductase [Bacteroidota bacterium]
MKDKSNSYDIMVVGGTPAGIMAAIAAGRMGSKVILTEYHNHIGGMSTSGLGKSDVENKETIAGLFKEFTERVLNFYIKKYGRSSENVKLCKEGYYYEPSVAEYIFNQMIAEVKTITLFLNHQIEKVTKDSKNISGVIFKNRSNGKRISLKAGYYIDATYEGDLYALAGCGYRIGREGKNEYNEKHAGKIFFDYNDVVFLEGSTGEGDKKLPAYTYRFCLTDDPKNSFILKEPPSGYNRENYLKYFDDLREGRLGPPKVFKEGHGYYTEHFNTMVRVFSFARIPNRKFDVNINPRPLGFPFAGENYTYPEADWIEREKIFTRHRELALGLLYFVQNDPEVPKEHREMARQYHLPLDEFIDNEHFPWQLYVREARRLKGCYVLTENDVVLQPNTKRNKVFSDSIISGEFSIDSFPVSKEPSTNKKVLEGYIGMLEIKPYQVPYRILCNEEIDNLIVPVAASTTHIAYSTIRMEPLWMGIGQAAGIAAHMASEMKADIKKIPVNNLQKILIENHQIITYFKDVKPGDKAFKAIQFWGTKGFFDSYYARPEEALFSDELIHWLKEFKTLINNGRFEAWTQKNQVVSITFFWEQIQKLIQYSHLSLSGQKDSFIPFDRMPVDWLYHSRDISLPVMRGEACLALYKLFFVLNKQ